MISLYDENGQEDTDLSFTLSNFYNDASGLARPGFIDNAIRGLITQQPDLINEDYTVELTNKLFR